MAVASVHQVIAVQCGGHAVGDVIRAGDLLKAMDAGGVPQYRRTFNAYANASDRADTDATARADAWAALAACRSKSKRSMRT
jgi:hypothetical protein